MVKNHLKRMASSPLMNIKRKGIKFLIRSNPGAHKLMEGVSLAVILRDLLNKANTMKEVKIILHERNILVDGKKRKDPAYIVGLMDVVSLEEIKEHYRLLFDNKGRFILVPVDEKEKLLKLCKIKSKNMHKGSINLHLHDGKTIITKEKDCKVGDSILIELPTQKIKQHIKFDSNNIIYVIGGRSRGKKGVLKEIKGNRIVFDVDKKSFESVKDYAMVIGTKQSLIKID